MNSSDSLTEQLCLQCALCCNGVIFADVELKNRAEATRLQRLGVPFAQKDSAPQKDPAATRSNPMKLPQPCAALEGCRCRVYSDRPQYCRQFECILFINARAGRLHVPAALRIIRTARQKADTVRTLLRELGNDEEQLPLAARFRHTAGKLEGASLDKTAAESYGRLTLAFHELNCLLSEAFFR